ncbi:MAG: CPBP family intramembrane metalloprotease [Oligoflexia bacterium]|nr:CPBP family intramembrane metalloprotease [Oligoflexia bacterium]
MRNFIFNFIYNSIFNLISVLIFATIFVVTSFYPIKVIANQNYHLTGWINTVIPGGGQFHRGNYGRSALEFAVEVGTFLPGYLISKRRPMTIDGVPSGHPQPYDQQSRDLRRGRYDKYTEESDDELKKGLFAATLQEIGLKFHMINVFRSYRESAADNNINSLDNTRTMDLFKAPFKLSVMSDPWVYLPIGLSTLYLLYDYTIEKDNVAATPKSRTETNIFYGFNNTVLYPFGSGAPEEMFYRGFIQNEAYSLVRSPYFSIPISALAFAFSHAPEGRPTAAVVGLYLGYLAYRHNGKLDHSIAAHFWGNLVMGVFEVLLYEKAQSKSPPQIRRRRNRQVTPVSLTFQF